MCGVGFVASALGKPSHDILQMALTALGRLEHRGAVAADGASSDGIGLMAQVPRALLLKETGIELANDALLGVGMMFIPPAETRAEAVMQECLESQELSCGMARCAGAYGDPWRNCAEHDAEDPAGAGRGCCHP